MKIFEQRSYLFPRDLFIVVHIEDVKDPVKEPMIVSCTTVGRHEQTRRHFWFMLHQPFFQPWLVQPRTFADPSLPSAASAPDSTAA
eukprot:SAG31_NODE_30202_length_384_cov_0.901754_2_plen_85_part_01